MDIKKKRILGNWLTAFISPLMGTTIAFRLDVADQNVEILLIALISSLLVTGLVISRTLEK